jgi:threonine aldolase
VLKYGSAKAKFTANVIFLQTLVQQIQAAARALVLKVQRHLVHVAKEAITVAATVVRVVTAEAVSTNAVVAIVRVVRTVRVVATVQVAIVPEVIVQAETDN